ncbi:Right handed beta helix region [Thermomonospora echinospora]|uniref:Right handed beta helix region n=1 Tax=Thermomonospora echinospora TaxID=1992 RepID=A0A1H5SPI8_9ACTN|nr:right-handed parallel beta-helix repeat-containing protein [Thermomonospora echinospora]SEF52350.1 Right handed beta helix region [Thermomonospora echinospora]
MTDKIDLKFVAGLLIGALVMGALVVVLMSGGQDGERAADQSVPMPRGPVGAGASEDRGEDAEEDIEEAGEEGEPFTSAGPPPDIEVPDGEGRVVCPAATRTVGDARELQTALSTAEPGDSIHLEDGIYVGKFVARAAGTEDKPIFLCGGENAVLDGGGIKKGYALHLNQASHWRLVGFTVRNSQKGVMADTTDGAVIQDLRVHDIGDEAIHLRNFSSGNTVQYNLIYNTGLRREKFGEGVYLGTAESNWKQFSGGKMDRSDRNVVRGNVIRATAEAIDVKEGTTGGRIVGNIFDGSVLGGSKHNDSWVDVKGNGYVIEDNRGTETNEDGFQTHEIVKGWGTGNVFRGNTIDLGGGGGVGIKDTAGGNTIDCDNKVTGGPLTDKGQCT